MPETIHMRRFTANYRLRPSQLKEKTRLDRLIPQLLGEPLELALERAGVRTSEIVCIRRIRIPVRLRLSRSDSELLTAWARLLAEAIAQGEEREVETLRYPSRPLALIQMGIHVSQGRFHNAWAWRQLDYWRRPADETPGMAAAVREFAGALEREPEIATAVIAELAAIGRFAALMRFLGDSLEDIAVAVLTAASGSGDWRVAAADRSALPAELFEGPEPEVTEIPARTDAMPPVARPQPGFTSRAERVVARSRILSARAGVVLSERAVNALMLLALLECEPALARAASAEIAASVRAIRNLLDPPDERKPRERSAKREKTAMRSEKQPREEENETPEEQAAVGPKAAKPRDPPALPITAGPTGETPHLAAAESSEVNAVEPHALALSGEPSPLDPLHDTALPRPAAAAPPPSAIMPVETIFAPPDRAPDELRRIETATDFGGLLFLLRILDRLDIPGRMMTTGVAAHRGLAWLLHRLALALQPLAPDDPAALVFCGLHPGARHPSEETPIPSTDELALVNEFADEIRKRLAEVLADALPGERLTPDRAMQFLCRRRAIVAADPGWVELRFALCDVSTAIRRAGLDLDPGYVPWLGVVVRFVYE